MSKDENIAERGANRSRQPRNQAFREFIGSNWGPRPQGPERAASADYLPARHAKLSERFRGVRLVLPAGGYKVRNNDCDYRFRAHSAFAHMTGLGGELEPDSVLVFNPVGEGHEVTLYFHPRASRSSEEFYADARYGEFWVGARPSLDEMLTLTGLKCAAIDTLGDILAKDLGQVRLAVVRGVDAEVETQVTQLRESAEIAEGATELDAELAEALSELRLVKDDFEIEEMRKAVNATHEGFEAIIASLERAASHRRGERVVEGAFHAKAREEGNGLGYDTIAASGNHANTLHWIDNDGPVRNGDLILVDAGVEMDSLYTADITRTVPVNGTFSPLRRRSTRPSWRRPTPPSPALKSPAASSPTCMRRPWRSSPPSSRNGACSPAQLPNRWRRTAASTAVGCPTAQAITSAWTSTTAPKPAVKCTLRPNSSRV